MSRPRALFVTAGAALPLLLGLASPATGVETPQDPATHFFHQTFGDFSEELTSARNQGKTGVLLFFEVDDCPFCHRMKRTVLNQPRVQRWYREHFLCFTVDAEGGTEVTDFQGRAMSAKDFAVKANRVRATPVLAFYDLSGRQVVRYTGAPKDVEEFLWLGEFVVEGLYKTTSFPRYKRGKRRGQ